jgi:hypothetical protein
MRTYACAGGGLLMIITIALLLLLVSAAAEAQTWSELQTVEKEAQVRVFEIGSRGWAHADGRLRLVKDDELTILKGGKPIVIPKASIERVEWRRNDPFWQGALIGTALGIVQLRRGAGQGCNSPGVGCSVGIIGTWTIIGTLVDWAVKEKKTVYRAP